MAISRFMYGVAQWRHRKAIWHSKHQRRHEPQHQNIKAMAMGENNSSAESLGTASSHEEKEGRMGDGINSE